MMNNVGKFALSQSDFRQSKLRSVSTLVDLQRPAKHLRSARRIAIFKKTFADSLEQPRIVRPAPRRQSERRARPCEQTRVA